MMATTTPVRASRMRPPGLIDGVSGMTVTSSDWIDICIVKTIPGVDQPRQEPRGHDDDGNLPGAGTDRAAGELAQQHAAHDARGHLQHLADLLLCAGDTDDHEGRDGGEEGERMAPTRSGR
jgi:hypothetical protein